MPKRRILILDCTRMDEPSEGRLLKEFFNICRLYKPAKASSLFYKVNSKRDFLKKLNTGKRYDIIHISAHGAPKGKTGIGNGTTWWATPEEIKETNHNATLIFVNACLANKLAIAEAFRSRYFLAPVTEVEWVNAALFSLMFYKRYIVDGVSMRRAFEYARNKTQTSSDYPNYWES
jgi:hypothetical protein